MKAYRLPNIETTGREDLAESVVVLATMAHPPLDRDTAWQRFDSLREF